MKDLVILLVTAVVALTVGMALGSQVAQPSAEPIPLQGFSAGAIAYVQQVRTDDAVTPSAAETRYGFVVDRYYEGKVNEQMRERGTGNLVAACEAVLKGATEANDLRPVGREATFPGEKRP